MPKTFVLDANVLLHDPKSLTSFQDNKVVILLSILKEIDSFKKALGQIGANARETAREIEKIAKKGCLANGIVMDNGGTLFIYNYHKKDIGLPVDDCVDHHLLSEAKYLSENGENAIVVSKDIIVRLIANGLEIQAEDYETDKKNVEVYSGYTELKVSSEIIDELNKNERIIIDTYKGTPNKYVTLVSDSDPRKVAFAKTEVGGCLSVIRSRKLSSAHISPKNTEQIFAMHALLDDTIQLVTLQGQAGTGKTLLAIACGVAGVISGKYSRLIVTRPVIPVGKDIGFLPGPQPLSAKILSINGWTTMGELKVGSKIIAKNGLPTNVIGIFPKGEKLVFKITTTDGTSTECCEDHLWFTTTAEERKRGKSGSVKSTKEIMNSLEAQMSGKKLNSHNPRYGKIRPNHFLPRNDAVNFISEDTLVIPPYLLGCILGDGCIDDSISIANIDEQLINRCSDELKSMNCSFDRMKDSISYNISSNFINNKPAKKVVVTDMLDNIEKYYENISELSIETGINKITLNSRCKKELIIDNKKYSFLGKEKWRNTIKNELFNLGLQDKKSHEKFIPKKYKYSSIENRLSIINGLMDTDGGVNAKGCSTFYTMSHQLALDLSEMIQSLGGRSIIKEKIVKNEKVRFLKNRQIISNRNLYYVSVSLPKKYNPFFIKRKTERVISKNIHGIGIVSIEPIGKKEVQCILIDNPEHLYITDNYIVTHNTIDEKMLPWMQPINDALDLIIELDKRNGKTLIVNKFSKDDINIAPLAYIRGRSIPNSYMIVDESQNLSPKEVKTLVTRSGEGTKIIFTGDIEQIDNPFLDMKSNGFSYLVSKFKERSIFAHIHLTSCERSELAELGAKLL